MCVCICASLSYDASFLSRRNIGTALPLGGLLRTEYRPETEPDLGLEVEYDTNSEQEAKSG